MPAKKYYRKNKELGDMFRREDTNGKSFSEFTYNLKKNKKTRLI